MPRDQTADLVDEILALWARDPLAFVRGAFRWDEGELAGESGPDEWQTEILKLIGDEALTTKEALRIAVASGHGVGKTALVAWIILWAMCTRPHLAGVVTANTQNQLTTKTWRELSVWHKRMEPAFAVSFQWTATRFYHAQHPETWFVSAVPWSKENSEAFAGLHAEHVLMLFDEASAIDNVIWEVAEGAMTTPGAMWLAFGNPTRNTGRFAECWGRFRHRWKTRQVDSRKAKKANQAQIAQWIEDYGEESDFVYVRVRGLFPRASAEQFIPRDLVADARKRTPAGYEGLPKVLGVDVARFGDDQTVFLLRQGSAILKIERHRNLDTMQTAARVAERINEWKPDKTFIDGVGVGGGVVDRLRHLNQDVVDVNAGGKAIDDRQFMNLRAEMWSKMRAWLGSAALPEKDEELASDLTGPEYHFDSRNRVAIERKEDMKKRGLASPDTADALALTFAQPVSTKSQAIPLPFGSGGGWESA